MAGQRTQLGQQVGLGGVAEYRFDVFRQAVQGLALEQCGQAVRRQVGRHQGIFRQYFGQRREALVEGLQGLVEQAVVQREQQGRAVARQADAEEAARGQGVRLRGQVRRVLAEVGADLALPLVQVALGAVLHREAAALGVRFPGADQAVEQLAQLGVGLRVGLVLEGADQQRRVQARIRIPAQAGAAAELAGQLGGGLGFGAYLGQQALGQARRHRQRHAGAGAHGHGAPHRGEVEGALALHLVQGQEAAPALVVQLETQAGEGRQEAPIAQGEEVSTKGDALLQGATLGQAEAFGEGVLAGQQGFGGFDRDFGHARRWRLGRDHLAVLIGGDRRFGVHGGHLDIIVRRLGLGNRAEQHVGAGHQQQLVAVRGEQDRAVAVVAQAVERHRLAIDEELAGLAQLGVVQCHLGQRLQHLGQATALDQHHEVAQAATGIAPQGHFGGLIEQLVEQVVAQLQVVLVDDAAQAAGQAEAVGVVLVVEHQVLGEGVAQQRHLEHVLGQAAQRGALDQYVRARQVEAQVVGLDQLALALRLVLEPGEQAGGRHRQRHGQAQQQRAPAARARSGNGLDGSGVLAHR